MSNRRKRHKYSSCVWCRLELKGNKYVLGEFVEFKGTHEDVQALRNVRRSKVGRLIIQKASMFGLGNLSALTLYYCLPLSFALHV